MGLKFSYEIGIDLTFQGERGEQLQPMFYAQRISDDHWESPIGEAVFGSSPKELAENVKKKIEEERKGEENFSWEVQHIRPEDVSRYRRHFLHKDYVTFLSAMSYAPETEELQ